MKLLLFGYLAEQMGTSEMELNDIPDTETLIKIIKTDFPLIKNSKFLISVDKKIVKGNTKLESGNVVALLPPFAGG
jgi:molybdopterin synthase sulfur carrier subunit